MAREIGCKVVTKERNHIQTLARDRVIRDYISIKTLS